MRREGGLAGHERLARAGLAKPSTSRSGARLVRRPARKGWATCAFTQLGFIRLSSNPAYTADAVSPQDAATLIQQRTRLKTHRFWTSPAADAPEIYARALGHQQVNDAWLVEVVRRNSGRLVTLDTRLPVHAPEAGLVEVIET